jgi:hypothetical protein
MAQAGSVSRTGQVAEILPGRCNISCRRARFSSGLETWYRPDGTQRKARVVRSDTSRWCLAPRLRNWRMHCPWCRFRQLALRSSIISADRQRHESQSATTVNSSTATGQMFRSISHPRSVRCCGRPERVRSRRNLRVPMQNRFSAASSSISRGIPAVSKETHTRCSTPNG